MFLPPPAVVALEERMKVALFGLAVIAVSIVDLALYMKYWHWWYAMFQNLPPKFPFSGFWMAFKAVSA